MPFPAPKEILQKNIKKKCRPLPARPFKGVEPGAKTSTISSEPRAPFLPSNAPTALPDLPPSPAPEAPSFPDTRPTLLRRLPDAGDEEAWRGFVETYGPLIYRFALRRGQQPSDAADIVQDVMLKVARGIGRFDYDPSRGRFRGWLFTIAWRTLIDREQQIRRRLEIPGDSIAETTPDPAADVEALWDREYGRSLLQHALPLVRPQFSEITWDAFHLTALEGLTAEDTAHRLGLTVGSVYVARSRVTSRLRERIRQIESEWEVGQPINA